MGMKTRIKKGVILSALAFSAVCLFQARAEQGSSVKKPSIVNNEPIVYLDNTDQISVQGEGIQSVSYSSGKKKVATISRKGKITPKKKGTATIRAKVRYLAEGQSRETTLSYSLKVLDKSKKYFKYAKENKTDYSKYDTAEIIGLTEAGKKIKTLYIPEHFLGKKVTIINHHAFAEGSAMEKIYISDYVEHLDYWDDYEGGTERSCFYEGCEKLQEIHLGKNVKYFGDACNLPKLKKITIASGNKTYQTRDGVLFEGTKELVLYPAGKQAASYAVPKGTEIIREAAFAWAKHLQQVTIPTEIKELHNTFHHSGLREVTLPEGTEYCIGAFRNCACLEKAVIPKLPNCLVMSNIFEGCHNLKSLSMQELPKCFTGDNLSGCGSLEKIQLPANVKGVIQKENVLFDSSMETLLIYPAGKKDQCYLLPDGIKKIQDSAFTGAQHLSEIILNKELLDIGDRAFEKAKIDKIQFNNGLQRIGTSAFQNANIKEAILPDSLRTLESGAFMECRKLSSVRLSPNIEELNYTFGGCSSLRTLHIPKSIKKIILNAGLIGYHESEDGLNGCTSLASITVENGNKYFTAMKGVLYNKSKTTLIVYPAARKDKRFSIPKSVKKISYGAFAGCSNIRELTMKDHVKTCGQNSFSYMKNLKKIRLSNNLKKITLSAFAGCCKMQKITIPDKSKKIDYGAFDNCTSLKSITLGKKTRTISENAFRDCRNLQKITFRKKTWERSITLNKCFVRTGSKNYRKLTVRVPKKWREDRELMMGELRSAGLSKKAKIKYY